MKNDFCVYVHCKKTDNTVFYVGKGSIKRAKSASLKSRNEYWGRIVKKYGFYPVILYKNLSEKEAFKIEMELISEIGRDKLCNLTDGGEGAVGRICSDEVKRAMSERFKGVKPSEKTIRAAIEKNSRPVGTVCGMRFNSLTDAARFIQEEKGIKTANKGNILSSANGEMKLAYGYEFRYLDAYGNLMPSLYVNKTDKFKTPVKNCANMEFESINDAARWLISEGICKSKFARTAVTNIISAITGRKGVRKAYGFEWRLVK